MRQSLVRPDWHTPDRALLRVADRLRQRVPPRADRHGGGHYPLGVKTREKLQQSRRVIPDQGIGRQFDVVEEQQVLLLRHDDVHVDGLVTESGRVGWHHEQGRPKLAGLGVGGAPDDQDSFGLIDARDVDLPAVQHPGVTVTSGDSGELVRV